MNEYLCGIKVKADTGEEAALYTASPAGINDIFTSESNFCMTTDVLDAQLGGIIIVVCSMSALIIGIVIGLHRKK